MRNTVIIKGNRYGISIILNNSVPFEELLVELGNRLSAAQEFFDCEKQLVVSFEGRELTNDELDQILTIIDLKTNLKISYILDQNSDLETTFYDIIQTEQEMEQQTETEQTQIDNTLVSNSEDLPSSIDNNILQRDGLFYKGTLRAGQKFETDSSIIIIGDVEKGACISAGGNIVIIGKLEGSARAGLNGNKNAFLMTLSMNAENVEICGIVARAGVLKKAAKRQKESLIAILIDEQIMIDPISKSPIHDFQI